MHGFREGVAIRHVQIASRIPWRTAVPEGRCRVDTDLHDRSLSSSAELGRLAVTGVAVVGLLVAPLPDRRVPIIFDDRLVKVLLSASLVALAASAGFALLHRFHAGGAAFHHLQVIKPLLLNDPQDEAELERSFKKRTPLFLRCHRFLTLASSSLVAGAGLLSGAFIRLLFA